MTAEADVLEPESPLPSSEAVEHVVDRALIRKAVVGLLAILAVAAVTGAVFEAPLKAAGSAFIDAFGLLGLFGSVLFTDASPLPLTNEPLVFLARGAGLDVWTIFWVVSAGSVTAGTVGYTAGAALSRVVPLERWLVTKQPALIETMRRYGAEGVAIAALLPIPFALSTWSAGMLGVSYPKVLLASLLRVPKTAFYVLLIVGALGLGG